MRVRLMALSHIKEGANDSQTARNLHISRRVVNDWLKNVDVWFQDEARFGQQNTTTRLWAEIGTRPRAVKQQQFEYAYLFGAVCPATDDTKALIAPSMNIDIMEIHLALISKKVPEGRHAVIVVGGAACINVT